ncbi:MAG: glycosyltransferase family 2 protein [Calditrichaeota bacterium]|nr:MAG: glycosyltransferase family 2 protein [Calditrichota bacterium]
MGFKPLFSIISVCHGRWYHLKETWSSWAKQTYKNFEIIIVASREDEPKTLLIASGFKGKVLRVCNLDYFRPSLLRNIGASYSLGEYLAFVDADNFLQPTWLDYCENLLKARFDIVVHQYLLERKDPGGCSGTFAIQRWLFEKIRGFNTNLDRVWGYEDTDLIIRAQKAGGRITGYPVNLTSHIEHSDEERSKNFKDNLPPRLPRTFLNQMRICDLDYQVHPYEANRIRRFSYPKVIITEFSK